MESVPIRDVEVILRSNDKSWRSTIHVLKTAICRLDSVLGRGKFTPTSVGMFYLCFWSILSLSLNADNSF